MIIVKSPREIELMREACRITAGARTVARQAIAAGVTTREIDREVHKFILRSGATPTFLNYNGFPASACVSVNEEVVHGIPGRRIVRRGDIVSVDVGAYMGGFHGDCAATFPCGTISPEAQDLINVTRQSFFEGIKFAKPGNHLNDISTAIQAYAESFGFGVVRDLVGHGIGSHLHEDPEVPNFKRRRKGILLQPGMTLAVEPMINAGSYDVVWMDDDWTVVTEDGSLSAHYENTILITEDGPEILSML